MPAMIEMTGRVFGELTVIGRSMAPRLSQAVAWLVRCSCGNTTVARGADLRRGQKSCGCLPNRPAEDLTGRSFGSQEVLGPDVTSRSRGQRWRVRCACGQERSVDGTSLRQGTSRSCGCERGRNISKAVKKHGATAISGRTPEYRTWCAMKERCERVGHRSYPDYGGRGIRVADTWRDDFARFLADVGKRPSPKHTIDRIENARGYEPGNVRWATRKEQNQNKRNAKLVTIEGETLCITEWARRNKLATATVVCRLQRGWDPVDAVTMPALPAGKKTPSRSAQARDTDGRYTEAGS